MIGLIANLPNFEVITTIGGFALFIEKRWLLRFLITLAFCTAQPVQAITVKELEKECQALLNFEAKIPDAHDPDFDEKSWRLMESRGYCVGVLEAAITLGDKACTSAQIFNVMNNKALAPSQDKFGLRLNLYWSAISYPNNYKWTELAEIFINWVRANPEDWQEDGIVGVIDAFQEPFPCVIK